MSDFDRLHPSVQHHIVNTLGWKSLRPLQEEAIAPLMEGHHVLALAPTAGGKTEAAVFPLFSRMLLESWPPLSVIYLCPIKALLNDLEKRLSLYAELLGRRVGLWHGDVGASQRKNLLRYPPDILLTTPESLEVMLDSRLVDHEQFLGNVRTVVVDETHAFAGDDRGWHLSALLSRIQFNSTSTIQRVGLSATVGNPAELLNWLVSSAPGERAVVAPLAPARRDPDVKLDYVASLDNAAKVIATLYRGEKRLVFCESRSQVEQLSAALRALNVETHASHSSLSKDQRHRAETAFAEGNNSVIVATSTLELGIDIGDLDRMIQINSPASVASFLQRLGRTGRRSDARSHCLFLALSENDFLLIEALLQLWESGFVEPVAPPPLPYHVLAQQILALVLQESALERGDFSRHLEGFLYAAGLDPDVVTDMLEHLLAEDILIEVGGIYSMGPVGEQRYGRRNFLSLFAVFNSPPLFGVFHGHRELGHVQEDALGKGAANEPVISLGGFSWQVKHIDWNSKRAWVEPIATDARTRWSSMGHAISWRLGRAARTALTGPGLEHLLTERGRRMHDDLCEEFAWLEHAGGSELLERQSFTEYWSFAGGQANSALARHFVEQGVKATASDLRLRIKAKSGTELKPLLRKIMQDPVQFGVEREIRASDRDRYKFLDLIPEAFAVRMMKAREQCFTSFHAEQLKPIRVVGDISHIGLATEGPR